MLVTHVSRQIVTGAVSALFNQHFIFKYIITNKELNKITNLALKNEDNKDKLGDSIFNIKNSIF